MNRETWVEDGDGAFGCRDFVGKGDFVALSQRDFASVDRELVEVRPVERGKTFELVERVFFFKHVSEQAHRVGRSEATGTATGVFFEMIKMRCAVGAKEETRVAGRGGFAQCEAVGLAFGDWQAVVVWLDSPKGCGCG